MARVLLLLAFALVASATPKPDGTCGYQCTADTDCGGCGTAGKCSCPDAGIKYPTISCSCVSAPANPPAAPEADVQDSVWPAKWTANVSAWSYGDFSDKTSTADGKFYFDGDGGHTRADWTPYINGKDATQVWIATGGSSKYYVKSGPLCIYFPITDPGQNKAQVGVERKDWMAYCNSTGFAKYVGREQVNGVWADHWSCHTEYTQVNQSITFQNWHSLGLDKVPTGLPLRVTGGNSAPNPTKGSPRLNSVWYSNFVTGDSSVQPSDFTKPAWLCIPVGMQASQVSEFFGFAPEATHTFSPEFQHKAHWLPHSRVHLKDLQRAQSKPQYLLGKHFGDAMGKLNSVLTSSQSLQSEPCESFSLDLLRQVQRVLLDAASATLNQVYIRNNDTRALRFRSGAHMEEEFSAAKQLVLDRPELHTMVRDGFCHETVMMYTHHLTESAREEAAHLVSLPLMPAVLHQPAQQDQAAVSAHQTYTAQVSCAVCHVQL